MQPEIITIDDDKDAREPGIAQFSFFHIDGMGFYNSGGSEGLMSREQVAYYCSRPYSVGSAHPPAAAASVPSARSSAINYYDEGVVLYQRGVSSGKNDKIRAAIRNLNKAIELDDDTRYPSSGTMYLMDYADTGEYTAVLTQAASAKRWSYSEGEYRYTSAINRLDLIPNTGSFRTGSTFSLYGMGN